MNAVWTMLTRMASAGGVLYFFPALFGYEAEVRSFFRRYMAIAIPAFILIFLVGCIALHAELENQKREVSRRLKGAAFRRPAR